MTCYANSLIYEIDTMFKEHSLIVNTLEETCTICNKAIKPQEGHTCHNCHFTCHKECKDKLPLGYRICSYQSVLTLKTNKDISRIGYHDSTNN